MARRNALQLLLRTIAGAAFVGVFASEAKAVTNIGNFGVCSPSGSCTGCCGGKNVSSTQCCCNGQKVINATEICCGNDHCTARQVCCIAPSNVSSHKCCDTGQCCCTSNNTCRSSAGGTNASNCNPPC